MDLCLSSYGFCNYVSGKHATIFFDKVCLSFHCIVPRLTIGKCQSSKRSSEISRHLDIFYNDLIIELKKDSFCPIKDSF